MTAISQTTFSDAFSEKLFGKYRANKSLRRVAAYEPVQKHKESVYRDDLINQHWFR